MAKYVYMQQPAFYDLFSIGSASLKTRQKFFLKHLETFPEVLEFGTGTGNIALYLADKGKHVVCVEPSQTALNTLYAKIFSTRKYDRLITILPCKAEDVDEKRKFKCVIIPNLLHLVVDETARRLILRKANALIAEGGCLIATFFPLSMLRTVSKLCDSERKVGNRLYRRFVEYKRLSGNGLYSLVEIRWTFQIIAANKTISVYKEKFLCRCDSAEYVRGLFDSLGFKIQREFADYSGNRFFDNFRSENLILVASKQRQKLSKSSKLVKLSS